MLTSWSPAGGKSRFLSVGPPVTLRYVSYLPWISCSSLNLYSTVGTQIWFLIYQLSLFLKVQNLQDYDQINCWANFGFGRYWKKQPQVWCRIISCPIIRSAVKPWSGYYFPPVAHFMVTASSTVFIMSFFFLICILADLSRPKGHSACSLSSFLKIFEC